METWIAAAASVLVAVFSFLGNYMSNRKSQALIAYRLEQLEKKVDKHNQVVERTFILEGQVTELQHDVRDLKGARR